MTPAELFDDPWAFGPWCWIVDRVELLPDQEPCRGMQGLWPLEDEMRRILSDLAGDPVYVGLTLLQPYASAIAAGVKRVENRPWRRPIPRGGLWVGLHAGASLYIPEEEVQTFRACRRTRAAQARDWTENVLDEWRAPPMRGEPHWPNAPTATELPLGCMLGAMRISAILRYPDGPSLLDPVSP